MKHASLKIIITFILAMSFATAVLTLPGCGNSHTDKSIENISQNPEDVVTQYFKSLSRHSTVLLTLLVDPAFLEQAKNSLGKDYDSKLASFFFSSTQNGSDFVNMEFENNVEGDKAAVKVVKGKVQSAGSDGKSVSSDLPGSLAVTFQLVRIDGVWYLSGDNFQGILPMITVEEPAPEPEAEPLPEPDPGSSYATCSRCGGRGVVSTTVSGACPTCGGAGSYASSRTCPDCGGAGVIDSSGGSYTYNTCGGSGSIGTMVTCGTCAGTGSTTQTSNTTCPVCGGSGHVYR